MEIKFDVYFKKNLGTLFKSNEVDLDGILAHTNLDLKSVDRLEANYKVGTQKYTDSVGMVDIEERVIQIPFKSDVVKVGLNEFEIVAYMASGDIKTSQTYTYHITEAIGRGNLPGSGDIGPSGEHIHINLAILDTITQAKIDSWNNKADKVHTHSEYLTELPTHTHSEYLTEHQDISHKADKVNTYTKTETDNKISQEIEKIELKEGPQGPQGDTPSIDHLETAVSNKINEIETRFSALTVSQQQSSEVIDARGGETSLKARLDKDSETVKNVYTTIEAPYVCVDSSEGHLKDLEILGNTVQDIENLSDIRSVGDKVEDKELYEIPFLISGKNLFNVKYYTGTTTSNKDTLEYDEINDTFKLTYSSPYSGIQFNMSDKIPYFEGKDFITSFNISNTASGLKSVSYLQGLDANGKNYYFNYANGFTIPKGTLVKLIFKVIVNNSSNAVSGVCTFSNLQIEEGTTITSYEPYQENKLTILSPTQLEKVGDVADRIICKDGIWGVEKSIETIYTKELDGNKLKFEDKTNTFLWSIVLDTLNTELVSSFMPIGTLSTEKNQTQIMIYNHNTYRELRMAFSKLDYPNFDNISNVKEYLNSTGKYIKIVQTPQFIPLPNDQQVKIRTFANKTNISLETEIEGTIKAQVPKTLGATVSIHNEQIDNLYQELEKIKQLLTENK